MSSQATWHLWSLLAGCVIGLVWGILLTYSHALSFADYLCRNCKRRNDDALAEQPDE